MTEPVRDELETVTDYQRGCAAGVMAGLFGAVLAAVLLLGFVDLVQRLFG